ncbi:hypothetical protein BDR07DRAFT_1484225 [Suillus spraguei]|nr:hypothetical protein BDR07DRAFT_1484225 [Suillus spraguei]
MSLRVLVVLDPQFSRSLAQDSYGCVDWVTYDYPASFATKLLKNSTLHGFVFRGKSEHLIRNRVGFIPLIDELLFWLRIQRKGMDVEFMKFGQFRDILISSNPDFERTFEGYHSIWGGLDLMCGGLDSPVQLQQYLSGLQILESIVPVWPPSQEMLHGSRKFNVINDLDQIASRMANSPRPQTTILSRTDISQSFEGWILKREGSDCNRHVLLPGQVDPLNLPPDRGQFRWLKQSYVPALRTLGEWRIVLVDCQPVFVVHTAPGNGQGELVFLHRDAGLSLAVMGLLMRRPYVFDDIMDPVGGTLSERRQADEELESFAKTVLNQLIEVEEESLGASSSLRLLVRLDLCVKEGPDGEFGYFINEVERGLGIGMFSSGNPRWTLRLADEFECVFSKWVNERCLAMERLIEPET